VPSSQEHNSLEHLTNCMEASDNKQYHSEPSFDAQPLPIADSNGKIYFVVPSIKSMCVLCAHVCAIFGCCFSRTAN
jgi:hypothetical protein